MTLISAHDLAKAYGPTQVLDGISVTIEDRDRMGLIGRNGAGKSTLVRILAGSEDADHGEIQRKRGLTLAVVEQAPRMDPQTTVANALRAGLAREQSLHAQLEALEHKLQDGTDFEASLAAQAALTAELDRLGAWNSDHRAAALSDALQLPNPSRILATLSLGEQRRVALAIGLLEAPELLVLDEPTNHLDVQTIEWLEANLRTYPGALLLVTHDRYFLDNVANRIAELDRGDLRTYDGNYTEYLVKKAEREAIEARTEHHRLRAIEDELKWVRASAPARTTKQKARLDRFDQVVANRPKAAVGEVRFRLPHPPRIGKTILELKRISKRFGNRSLIEDLTVSLKKGDLIGIIGPNGAGKTTLLKMILGELAPDAGEIVRGQNTVVVYADQGRADLDPSRSVLEEVAGDGDKVWVGENPVQVQTFLSQLLFEDNVQRTKVGALSGGEKSRVALAKVLRIAGNVLILDEPTNDLDLATLRVLEEALLEYPGCALIVSHDRYFLDRVTTAVLAFEGDGKVVLYEGSHQLYRERLARQEEAQKAQDVQKKASDPVDKPKKLADNSTKKKKRTFKEQKEFEAMEALILAAETEVEKLEQVLADPAQFKQIGARMPEKLAALAAAKAEVESLYARWSVLSDLESYG